MVGGGGNRGTRAFISGEQRPDFEGNRGTKRYWGTGNNIKQNFQGGDPPNPLKRGGYPPLVLSPRSDPQPSLKACGVQWPYPFQKLPTGLNRLYFRICPLLLTLHNIMNLIKLFPLICK